MSNCLISVISTSYPDLSNSLASPCENDDFVGGSATEFALGINGWVDIVMFFLNDREWHVEG